jgi:F-type H+-transporting ATPase subunit a
MKGLFPEVVFTVAGLPIRDTVITTWLMILMIVALMYGLRRRYPAALEMLVEFILDTVSGVMGRPAAPYLPLLGSLAMFIAVANLLGLVPVLQAPTRDINTPLALALIVFVSVHFYGIRERGLLKYLRGMADPIFLLPLDLIGQLSRTLSLTLRLFGNVLSSELIVAVVFSLLPLIAPLPLVAFGMLTGVLQAYIFTVLAAVYVGAAVAVSEPVENNKRS